MFAKQYRLRRDREFKHVFRKGKGVFDSACGVRFLKNGLDHSRFAVVVGTKVSKSAVKRNRIRRQYREIVKKHMEDISPGYDIVLLCGKEALNMEFEKKEKNLLKVLEKAKLL